MKRHIGEEGFAYAYVAIVLAFIILPLSIASADLVRLAWARAELQKAADAAAEAGAQMADVDVWRWQGIVQLLPEATAVAKQVANANSSYLIQKGIYPTLDYIVVGNDIVYVSLSATVKGSILYGPQLRISAEGTSELRFNRQ